MNGNWELGAFLLEKGADPNADRQGWTALHQIARSRRTNIGWLPAPPGKGNISSLDLVEKLLQDGADVNARMARDFRDGYRNRMNRVGATPFLLSAKSVDTEMMRTLLTLRRRSIGWQRRRFYTDHGRGRRRYLESRRGRWHRTWIGA